MPVLFRDRSRPDAEHPLYGVGGWLALFLGIVAIQAVVILVRLPGTLSGLSQTSPEAVLAFPVLLPLVVLEGVYPFAYLIAAPIGAWLAFKRDPRTPGFWAWFIAGVLAYGAIDIALAEIFLRHLAAHATAAQMAATKSGMTPAVVGDLQRIVWALIWGWYWKDSERVHVTFGRNSWSRSVPTATVAPEEVQA